MAIITGTSGDDTLVVNSDTTSVQAGAGADTAVFSGNYADYTLVKLNNFNYLITHNATNQKVELEDVELLQFNDGLIELPVHSGTEFQVSSNGESPSATVLADGGFVVTWQGSYYGIYAQRYDASGNTQGSEFQVNTYASSSQSNPSTTALNDGGFVITWSGEGSGDSNGIYAQRYDVDGTTSGIIFHQTSFVEDGLPTILSNHTFDFDLITNGDYSNTTLTFSRYAAANTVDVFSATGNLMGVAENGVLVLSGAVIGVVTQNSNGVLTLTFSSNATQAKVNEVISSIKYAHNSNAPPESVRIDWTFDNHDLNTPTTVTGANIVSIIAVNDSPILNDFTMSEHAVMATVDEDAYYEHNTSLHFIDPDGDTLTYSATLADDSVLPSWISIDNVTGVLSGTPLNDDVGVITIKVVATDDSGASAFDTYTLTINNTNDEPTLVSPIADAVINDGAPYSFNASSNFADVDGDNDYFTYSATLADGSALPAWLSIDSTTGILSGIPTNDDIGLIDLTITATDSANSAVSDTFNLTINNVNDAPTGQVFIDGNANYAHVLTASNTLGDYDGLGVIQYQWLANGIAIDGATNAAYMLTGTEVGKTITVNASYTDGQGTFESVTSAATSTVVNDNPQGTSDSIAMKDNTTYVLKASDFGFNDTEDGATLTAVRFDSLPETGNLRYLGADMFTGIYISKAELDEGWITYTPVENTSGGN